MAIFDLGPRLLDFFKRVIVADFPLIEDVPAPDHYDIVFVEGAVISSEDENRLKQARKKSDILVAIGSCACLGGIAEIKNYQDKEERIRYVYKNIEGIHNPQVKSLKEVVRVDYQIPGCPMNSEEFLRIATELVVGKKPKIPQRSVCYQCQLAGNDCLLQKGLPCLGPIILGGCGAPCPAANYPCDGCRGPRSNLTVSALGNMKKLLADKIGEREAEMIFERFGIKDELLAKLEKK